jgi:hypothetical protein
MEEIAASPLMRYREWREMLQDLHLHQHLRGPTAASAGAAGATLVAATTTPGNGTHLARRRADSLGAQPEGKLTAHEFYRRLERIMYEASLGGSEEKRKRDLQQAFLWYRYNKSLLPQAPHRESQFLVAESRLHSTCPPQPSPPHPPHSHFWAPGTGHLPTPWAAATPKT